MYSTAPSRLGNRLEVRESRSLYVHCSLSIFFCVWFGYDFKHPYLMVSTNNNNNNNNNNDNNNNTIYLDVVRELNEFMEHKKMMVILTVNVALGTISKGLVQVLEELKIGGRAETIQTTALLRLARILRRVLKTWGDLLSLRLQWKTISCMENSPKKQ